MKRKIAVALMVICVVLAGGCGGKDNAGASGNHAPEETETDGGKGTADVNGSAEGNPGQGVEAGDSEAGGTDSTVSGAGDPAADPDGTGTTDPEQEDPADVMRLRIVDGAKTGNLILAGEGAGEVYTLSTEGTKIFLDGTESMPSVLEDGMLVEIREAGDIMETYPAQLGRVGAIAAYSRGSEQNPLGTYYDLCGLYLEVLNDLWDKDSGLNEGAVYVSVDLSEAPGELTQGEKDAVAWIFASAHGAEALTMTYQELAEQGWLSEYGEFGDEDHKVYEWTNGVLFSVTAGESEENAEYSVGYSLPVLKFSAEKWRTPLGAYFFQDCKAVWSESGLWGNYSVGAEAIS